VGALKEVASLIRSEEWRIVKLRSIVLGVADERSVWWMNVLMTDVKP
jgi:hypothetical protein